MLPPPPHLIGPHNLVAPRKQQSTATQAPPLLSHVLRHAGFYLLKLSVDFDLKECAAFAGILFSGQLEETMLSHCRNMVKFFCSQKVDRTCVEHAPLFCLPWLLRIERFRTDYFSRNDHFFASFIFRTCRRSFSENVLQIKNTPPTVVRIAAPYERGTPVGLQGYLARKNRS